MVIWHWYLYSVTTTASELISPFFNPSSPFSNMSLCSFKNAHLVITPLLQTLYVTVESLAQCFLVDFFPLYLLPLPSFIFPSAP